MEEIMIALHKIQSEMDEQKHVILKSAEKVTEQVTLNINYVLEEKFKLLDEKYENLKIKIENQEKRLYFIEKQSRKNNIVLFGLKETETSYSNFESNILNFVKDYFSQELDRRDIKEVKRIGKKGEKSRPIIITFSTLGIKIDIFRQRNMLKDSGYYITEDYPQNILEKRKKLQEQARIEKEKGKIVTIKYDKLVIRERNETLGKNNKRMLSTSPDVPTPKRDGTNVQAFKKKKSQTTFRRTSSLSEGTSKQGLRNFLTSSTTEKKDNKKENI